MGDHEIWAIRITNSDPPNYQAAGIVTLSGSATSPILPSMGPDVFNDVAIKDACCPFQDLFDPWDDPVSLSKCASTGWQHGLGALVTPHRIDDRFSAPSINRSVWQFGTNQPDQITLSEGAGHVTVMYLETQRMTSTWGLVLSAVRTATSTLRFRSTLSLGPRLMVSGSASWPVGRPSTHTGQALRGLTPMGRTSRQL